MPVDSRPLSFSISFILSCFMLGFSVHLEFSFMQGDKYESILFLVHVIIEFVQNYMLKMLSVLVYISGFLI